MKLVSESTPDVRVGALAFDGGLQYADRFTRNTVKYQHADQNPAAGRGSDIRFGVSIKNLGTDAKYSGDGLAFKSRANDKNYDITTTQRSDKTPLPSMINIGLGYDFRLDGDSGVYWHRLTTAFNFNSNTAMSNQTSLGLEYAYKEMLMLRAGYNYEKGIFNYETRNNAYTGLNLGATFQIPVSKANDEGLRNLIAVDYSFRSTRPFSGTHTFGVRISIN